MEDKSDEFINTPLAALIRKLKGLDSIPMYTTAQICSGGWRLESRPAQQDTLYTCDEHGFSFALTDIRFDTGITRESIEEFIINHNKFVELKNGTEK